MYMKLFSNFILSKLASDLPITQKEPVVAKIYENTHLLTNKSSTPEICMKYISYADYTGLSNYCQIMMCNYAKSV